MKVFKLITLILIMIFVGCAPYTYQSRPTIDIPKDKPVNLLEAETMIQGFEPNPQDIKIDTTLVPATYYKKVWNYLLINTRNIKVNEQLEILEPWLISTNYGYSSLSEKLFLVDILSWASILHMQSKDRKLSSLASFSAAAILHSCFGDIKSRYFSNALGNFGDFDFTALSRMESMIEKEKRILSRSSDNIRAGRDLLHALGYTAYYIEGVDFFKKLFSSQSDGML
jgi:hypothetical protein